LGLEVSACGVQSVNEVACSEAVVSVSDRCVH